MQQNHLVFLTLCTALTTTAIIPAHAQVDRNFGGYGESRFSDRADDRYLSTRDRELLRNDRVARERTSRTTTSTSPAPVQQGFDFSKVPAVNFPDPANIPEVKSPYLYTVEAYKALPDKKPMDRFKFMEALGLDPRKDASYYNPWVRVFDMGNNAAGISNDMRNWPAIFASGNILAATAEANNAMISSGPHIAARGVTGAVFNQQSLKENQAIVAHTRNIIVIAGLGLHDRNNPELYLYVASPNGMAAYGGPHRFTYLVGSEANWAPTFVPQPEDFNPKTAIAGLEMDILYRYKISRAEIADIKRQLDALGIKYDMSLTLLAEGQALTYPVMGAQKVIETNKPPVSNPFPPTARTGGASCKKTSQGNIKTCGGWPGTISTWSFSGGATMAGCPAGSIQSNYRETESGINYDCFSAQ